MSELYHHGIIGQKWGIRRFQNEDGTLTDAGRRRMEAKDAKWAKRNYNRIYNKTYNASKKIIREYDRKVLKPFFRQTNKNGKVNKAYAIEYNRALAQLMTEKASNISAPSGRAVKFVAKRGEIGVHMALADANYDMSQLKNGVYDSGKIAYKSKQVNMA